MVRMHRHGIVSALVLAAAMPLALHAQAPAQGTPAQDTAKGAALLAEARKAVGGEDKLTAIQRLEIRGQMRTSSGNLNIDGDSQVFVERPDKFKRKDELSLGAGGPSIERVQVLTPTEFVEETSQGGMPGRGGFDGGGRGGGFRGGGNFGGQQGGQPQGQAPQVDPERLRETQRRNLQTDVSRMLLAVLLATDTPAGAAASTVAWVGTAQSPDGTADVLEITPANGPVTRLLLDTNTHMPLMLTWTGGGAGGFAARGGNAGRGRFGGGAPPGGEGGARGGDAPAAPPAGAPAPGAGAAPAGAGAPPAGGPGGEAAQGRRGGGGGRGGAAGATTQMFLSDYKVVNGLKLPHLLTRGSNGETAEEFVIKSYRINPNFKADTFKK